MHSATAGSMRPLLRFFESFRFITLSVSTFGWPLPS